MSSSESGFPIEYQGFKMLITLVEPQRLHPHEEIIPPNLDKLKASIWRDGFQASPIIVDQETLVVLDGMHRLATLKDIGCRFILSCLVDYYDPRISVETWCRGLRDRGVDPLALVEDAGYPTHPSGDRWGESLMLATPEGWHQIGEGLGVEEAFRALVALEEEFKGKGFAIDHISEAQVEEGLASGTLEAALVPPRVGKEQVVSYALEGRLFPPKSTRHVLPARPIDVDIPLEDLMDQGISLAEAVDKLVGVLSGLEVEERPPGATYHGRVYSEALIRFKEA